jgi:Ricin-type beta-trefoil lectin domain-like
MHLSHRHLAVLTAVLTAALALLGVVVTRPADAAEQTWQRLNAFHSNLVATVDGGSVANNAQVVQGAFDPNWWDRQWKVIPLGNGWFKYENRYSHQCLDAKNHSAVDGAPVVQNPCDASASQRWYELHHQVLPTILLVNGGNSGLYLTVQYGGFGQGAKFILTPGDVNRANQMFQRW